MKKTLGYSMLAVGLSGCAFYTSLLGYPSAAKPSDFAYYDSNFRANNSALLAESKIQFGGFYFNHDTAVFEYNAYKGNRLVRKKAATYRYLKFFDDGRMVSMSSITPPDSTIKMILNRAPWFRTGYFKLVGDTIQIETKNELEGNKSYFHKAVAYKAGTLNLIRVFNGSKLSLEYQHLAN